MQGMIAELRFICAHFFNSFVVCHEAQKAPTLLIIVVNCFECKWCWIELFVNCVDCYELS